jgi:hypothetical protein
VWQNTFSDHYAKHRVALFQVLLPFGCITILLVNPEPVDDNTFRTNESNHIRKRRGSSVMLAIEAESHHIFFE